MIARYHPAMRLLLGTTNRGKVIEIGEALAGLSVEILSAADAGVSGGQPAEEGPTYAENSRIKARHYFARSGMPTLADDSGIHVDALAGELGIHTRRWGAGADASDEEWIAHFLRRMEREENKRARFVCALHFVDAAGRDHAFEGICDGAITAGLEAEYLPGLPISACFRPDGHSLVYSALSIPEKNAVSHRGKAMAAFREFLIATLREDTDMHR